jgi:hypothetical protein
MKKIISLGIIALSLFALLAAPVSAGEFTTSNATYGEITGKTAVAGLLSFLIWPGLGQYMNDCETDKNVTHAVLGITQIYRFWSGWDAIVNRQGGYWKGRI